MIKILVIEDEKRVADLLKIGLEENGYQVLVAYDGEMGWRLFQSNDFQLIIPLSFGRMMSEIICFNRMISN